MIQSVLKRYALAVGVLSAAVVLFVGHGMGLFPRPGLYDVSRLIGASLVQLEGTVLDFPSLRWGQTRFLLEGSAQPLRAFQGRTIVTLAFRCEDLAPGDRIRVRGWLSAPREPSLSRDFNERRYWAGRRVFSMLKVWSEDGVERLSPAPRYSLRRLAWVFYCRYRDFWQAKLPSEEAGLLLGITVGAKGVLPSEVKEQCIRAGVYHIVVVSGQNMSLIVGLGVLLLGALRVPRRQVIWVCAMPIVFYCTVVGGDPPVTRAAVMALTGLFCAALGRDIPRYYPILLATGWILLQEPEALLGASFQLSFGATLSIIIFYSLWETRKRRRSHVAAWLEEAGLMGLVVHIGIWPLLIYYFHRLSFAGFLANWTVFPLSGILMILGLVVGTWGVLAPGSVPQGLITATEMLVRWTLAWIGYMSRWRWAYVTFASPPLWAIIVYYAILFSILFMVSRRSRS